MNKSHSIYVNGVNVLTGEEFNVLGLLFKVIELKEERVSTCA